MFEYYVATHSGVLGNNGDQAPKREKLALIDRRISEAHRHASEVSGHSQVVGYEIVLMCICLFFGVYTLRQRLGKGRLIPL